MTRLHRSRFGARARRPAPLFCPAGPPASSAAVAASPIADAGRLRPPRRGLGFRISFCVGVSDTCFPPPPPPGRPTPMTPVRETEPPPVACCPRVFPSPQGRLTWMRWRRGIGGSWGRRRRRKWQGRRRRLAAAAAAAAQQQQGRRQAQQQQQRRRRRARAAHDRPSSAAEVVVSISPSHADVGRLFSQGSSREGGADGGDTTARLGGSPRCCWLLPSATPPAAAHAQAGERHAPTQEGSQRSSWCSSSSSSTRGSREARCNHRLHLYWVLFKGFRAGKCGPSASELNF